MQMLNNLEKPKNAEKDWQVLQEGIRDRNWEKEKEKEHNSSISYHRYKGSWQDKIG